MARDKRKQAGEFLAIVEGRSIGRGVSKGGRSGTTKSDTREMNSRQDRTDEKIRSIVA